MPFDRIALDALRRCSGPAIVGAIDALVAGRLTRREFMRYGSVLGLSPHLLIGVTTALGLAGAPRQGRAATPGGTLRFGQVAPVGGLDPARVADPGGITQLAMCGEYLCTIGPDSILRPGLATSWSPNLDGNVWTFKIREGVSFHNGKAMTAADVAATFARLADPDGESNALTIFEGYLSKSGVRAVDASTVEFHLEAPHGQFPYLVSSDNVNAIILPTDHRDDFERNQTATGPFRLEQYAADTGAVFVRNDGYWGSKALPDRIEATFFADDASTLEALRLGKIDIIARLPQALAATVAAAPAVQIIRIPSSAHNQLHMRTDSGPFKDPRVRRAVALALDRAKIAETLLSGRAQIGNDSPFAPFYSQTDKTVTQRARNLAEAKALLQAAGVAGGFAAELASQSFQEIPAFALAIKAAVAELGVTLNIASLAPAAYFADGVFGKSPWLDSAMGITDYVHHGIPNGHLTAPLRSDGAWNAAHYKNPAYDRQVATYIAALDIDSQRKAAGDIQRTLLEDTPVIFAYFTDALAATRKGLSGAEVSPHGQVRLAAASLAT